MLSKFTKVFERKVWHVQVAHLHNAARALSSRSRCFQLPTNLDKDFLRYLWYCGKKQIECGLAWSVLLSTLIRVITVFKISCETISSSDTSTKHETATFKLCTPTIITSLGVNSVNSSGYFWYQRRLLLLAFAIRTLKVYFFIWRLLTLHWSYKNKGTRKWKFLTLILGLIFCGWF